MKQIQRERASTGSPWRSADPDPVIDFPGGNPTLTTPGVARLTAKVNNVPLDLSEARIVWEVEGGEPGFGQTASVGRSMPGTLQVEAEAVLPDGRRVFASKIVLFNDPNGGSSAERVRERLTAEARRAQRKAKERRPIKAGAGPLTE